MIGEVIIEFQNITKYPILDFLERYRNFMLNDYEKIQKYFGGQTESIDNACLSELTYLTTQCREIQTVFKNFANKFSACSYWELMDFMDDLNSTIEKINKLPKFMRTSLSRRGYTPSVQMRTTVGGERTVEDIANAVNGINQDNTSWVDIMLGNDLNEADWSIDKLKGLDIFVNNVNKVVVTTILDQPIGDRIYGRDIKRKIQFKDNDLVLVEYRENVEQKCVILLEMNQGDVPENKLFGKNVFFLNNSIKSMSYSQIAEDIRATFMQNDLFEEITLKDISFNQGSLTMTFDIKTKYDYETEKTIVL